MQAVRLRNKTIQLEPQEFSQEEIDEMKQKAVIITMNSGTFFIEFFPEEAPNTVYIIFGIS